MNKFIILTSAKDRRPVNVKVKSNMYFSDSFKYRNATLIDCRDQKEYHVLESPEEILIKIKESR